MKKNFNKLLIGFFAFFFINCSIVFADTTCDKYATHNEEICNYETSSSGKASCRCLYDLTKNNSTTCDNGYENKPTPNTCEASFNTTNNFSGNTQENKSKSYVASVSSGLYYSIDCYEGTYISEGTVNIYNSTTKKNTTVNGCLYMSGNSLKATCNKGNPAKINVTTANGEIVKGDFYVCYEDDSAIKGTNGEDASVSIVGDTGPRLEYNNLCESEGFKTSSKIAGIVILIVKWLSPLILTIFGMIDFFKAIISGNEKSLNDATTTFIKRIVIAIIIPIIPGLLFYLIDFFVGDEVNDTKIEFGECTKCLKDPLNCEIELYDYDK